MLQNLIFKVKGHGSCIIKRREQKPAHGRLPRPCLDFDLYSKSSSLFLPLEQEALKSPRLKLPPNFPYSLLTVIYSQHSRSYLVLGRSGQLMVLTGLSQADGGWSWRLLKTVEVDGYCLKRWLFLSSDASAEMVGTFILFP